MCGRFSLGIPTYPQLAEWLGVMAQPKHSDAYRPRYNIAPTDSHWILANENGKRELRPARWGLRPTWMKDEKHPGFINARMETVEEKPAFRDAFRHRRCLIPADGFYEWTGTRGKKKAFWFSSPEKRLLLMAGLFEWSPSTNHTLACSFTILTTSANAIVAPIHDRMPVLLSPSMGEVWLRPSPSGLSLDFRRTIEVIPEKDLTSRAVSDYVNSTRNDDSGCIEPLKEELHERR